MEKINMSSIFGDRMTKVERIASNSLAFEQIDGEWFAENHSVIEYLTFSDDGRILFDVREYTICQVCEEVIPIEEAISTSIGMVCKGCIERSVICDRCGKYHPKCDSHSVTSHGKVEHWCNACTNFHAYSCEHCERFFDRDEMYETYDGFHICIHCRVSNYLLCHECGRYVHYRDAEDNGMRCPRCALLHRKIGSVRRYHDSPELIFHKVGDEVPEFFIGTEIETQQKSGTTDDELAITNKFGENEKFIYSMRDGSLGYDGIEFITQPMTKEFFDNFDFENWFKELIDAGAVSHYCKNDEDGFPQCGLHVHLSRTIFDKYEKQEYEIIGMIRSFIVENQSIVEKFSRRMSGGYYNYKNLNKVRYHKQWIENEKKSTNPVLKDEFLKAIGDKSRSRYVALNDQNINTIEFRIFRGTLNPQTYRASVEFCIRIVDYCATEDFSNQTWEGFLNYKPLPDTMRNYLKRRCLINE